MIAWLFKLAPAFVSPLRVKETLAVLVAVPVAVAVQYPELIIVLAERHPGVTGRPVPVDAVEAV